MPKKEGFIQKFYNAVKGYAGFSTIPTLDDVREVYGPAQTLGAPEDVRVAMDSQLYDSGVYSLIQHTLELGQMPMAEFVGYGMLQTMSQNGLLRACIETVADDMTRNWIKLERDLDDPDADADGEVTPEEKERIQEKEREGETLVDEMMRTMRKYHLREVFHDAQELVGYEGGAMIYIDTGAMGEELKTPLNLTNYTGELKMGDLKGFIVVDPVNVFPGLYNSTDPLRTDYFVPKTWWVLGQEVHESRLVRLVDNEVPILLRPSYNFMGIPQAQILWDYVLHFQQCRTAATELVAKHSMTVFKTQIGDILFSGEGTRALDTRIKYFKQNRDNLNIVAIDKENEDLVNVESSVAGVDAICKQSLEYLAAINRTPAVKLLGLSPTGFNATGESDIRNYYDHIKSQQEKIFRDGLQKCLDVLQLNLNGKIDKSLKFEFVQLSEEDKNTLVQYQKTKADVIGGLLDHNIISGEEARKALSDDPDSGFSGLDAEELPEQEEETPPDGEGDSPDMSGELPEGMGGEEAQELNPAQTMDAAPDDPNIKAWITTETGSHIPVKEGETKREAVKSFVTSKEGESSVVLPKVTGKNGKSVPYKKTTGQVFTNKITSAKDSRTEYTDKKGMKNDSWRVDVHDIDDYDKNTNAFHTPGGSVVAVVKTTDEDHTKGDIISACVKPGSPEKGSDILKIAIANGGDRLDSFEGNHDFYVRNGFEPVSWCKFSDEHAPDEWKAQNKGFYNGMPDDKLNVPREDVIFYRYTGKPTTETAKEFKQRVAASNDYYSARDVRNSLMDEGEQ